MEAGLVEGMKAVYPNSESTEGLGAASKTEVVAVYLRFRVVHLQIT